MKAMHNIFFLIHIDNMLETISMDSILRHIALVSQYHALFPSKQVDTKNWVFVSQQFTWIQHNLLNQNYSVSDLLFRYFVSAR